MSDKRRWRAVLGWAALAMFGICCTVIVTNGLFVSDPIDYRVVGVVAGLTVLVSSVVMGPLFAIRLARSRAVAQVPRNLAVTLVALGVVAVAGVCALRGVITPWAPVAASTDAACPALERAGLGQAWPAAPHERTRDDVDPNDLGVFSYCSWTIEAEKESQPDLLLTSFVWLYENTNYGSALGQAVNEYRDRYDDASRRRALDGVGDEAFASDSGDRTTVLARRANVLIQVEIGPSTSDAERIVQELVRKMAAGVSPR